MTKKKTDDDTLFDDMFPETAADGNEGGKEGGKEAEAGAGEPVKKRKRRNAKAAKKDEAASQGDGEQPNGGNQSGDAQDGGSPEEGLPPVIREVMRSLGEMFGGSSVSSMQAFVIPGGPLDGEHLKERKRKEKERIEAMEQEAERETQTALKGVMDFNYTPRQIRDYLDRFVISQAEAKKVLSVAICDHYNYIKRCLKEPSVDEQDHAKHNVIMMGPTGVGKTYIMRCLAKLVGVPFIKADATKYSETGYVGYDVEDIIRDLVKAANGNVELAQYGIVYIDEIDKLCSGRENHGRDVSGRGVQVNLLKVMEDSEVKLANQNDMFGQMRMAMNSKGPSTIRTKNILFIVSGAFDKLSDIVRKRLGKSQIGFGRDAINMEMKTDSEVLQEVRTGDLVEYGFEPEFIGRLPVRVSLSDLCAEDLQNILLKAENNYLKQYIDAFAGYGIELSFSQDAVVEIAAQAMEEKTGARGLLTVLERTCRDFKFELPGTGANKLCIDLETVRNPGGKLGEMMRACKCS